MPFFKRSYLIENIKKGRHEYDRQFNALLHSICAYTLFQAIHAQDKPLLPDRLQLAESVLSYVAELHSGPDFGQDPSVEDVMTSFFLFGCQFCRNNHKAAQFRFREAMSLAEILGLHDPASYGNISPDEADRRVRTVTAMAFVERIYALQHGSTLQMPRLMGLDMMPFHKLIKRVSSTEESIEDAAVDGLGRMIDQVDFVDETVVRCWKSNCSLQPQPSEHPHVSSDKLVSLLRRYKRPLDSGPMMKEGSAQHADILLTRHWVRSMLWNLALRHGFINPYASEVELRPEYAVEIAAETIEACATFDIRCLETHGVGLAEKLFNVASNCARVARAFPARTGGVVFEMPIPGLESGSAAGCGPLDSTDFNFDSSWASQVPIFDADWSAPQGTQVPEILNRFLALFALFRKGNHPFLKPFMQLMASLDFTSDSDSTLWSQEDNLHVPLVM
ncbi:hypothetical protein CkaCkLH20_04452 [Colletotrichum karsti]|uniref:Transcription factor domain-containing protein n=1 Tax=Colletotrichum karsti TaxID=1095194 RepID=A0A9P6LM64_9PEZI|nr:uncharacterized protein CkaCkLH20_04452 [Colletotrichum karsti]KAF9877876.1 hypothetical protein CkaCkLH20_04452 [Colletotrichum karsti]